MNKDAGLEYRPDGGIADPVKRQKGAEAGLALKGLIHYARCQVFVDAERVLVGFIRRARLMVSGD